MPQAPAPRPFLSLSLPPPAALPSASLAKAKVGLEEVQGHFPGNCVDFGVLVPGCASMEREIRLQQCGQ